MRIDAVGWPFQKWFYERSLESIPSAIKIERVVEVVYKMENSGRGRRKIWTEPYGNDNVRSWNSELKEVSTHLIGGFFLVEVFYRSREDILPQ